MNEKVTIGGISYEVVGSKSSNLLLRCNGTARIEWGNKLIDLIKNGKIVSDNKSEQIFIISDESEMKSDGLYILNKENSSKIYIYKNKTKYNLTEDNLYISTTNKQNVTAEQKIQALENIGMYYNTLDEVKQSGIQNGIVYVLEDKNLYTIFDGVINEFEAKLKTITVEQENQREQGNTINNSVKIILSIKNDTYLSLENDNILINKPISLKNHTTISSENYDVDSGYSIYIRDGKSYLDIDNINVRNNFTFSRGMIMMYYGLGKIPEGWAICDGTTHTYNGVTTTTPNLTNRFIKAVTSIDDVGLSPERDDLSSSNEFTLKEEHLPNHTHPHQEHTHDISKLTGSISYSGNLTSGVFTTDVVKPINDEQTVSVINNISGTVQNGTNIGGNHTHDVSISEGIISNTISLESEKVWENKSFSIEPNYYALIFIMKL